jgi:hypothetical protein
LKPKPAAKIARVKAPPPRTYLVRIFTGRGTDHHQLVVLPGDYTPQQIRETVAAYAERYVAGTAICGYTVSWRRVRVPSRDVWRRRWNRICQRKRRLDQQYNELRALGQHPLPLD